MTRNTRHLRVYLAQIQLPGAIVAKKIERICRCESLRLMLLAGAIR